MIPATSKPQLAPLDTLIREHSAGVFRYLRSVVRDEEASRDLLHDTFLKLSPRATDAGRALVYTVARSCALDYLRRRRTRQKYETLTDSDFLHQHPAKAQDRPDSCLAAKALRQDLLTALSRLPEDQRTVFHLSEIEGLSYAEIATVLAVSPGTIASRKHHAVLKLRDILRRRGHGA